MWQGGFHRWIPVVASNWTPESTGDPPVESSYASDFTKVSAPAGGFWIPVASQKNRPVASEMPRFARQHTQCTERNRKINDLAEYGESSHRFFGMHLTEKTVEIPQSETVLAGASDGRSTLSKTPYLSLLDPDRIPGWIPEANTASTQRKTGERAPRRTLPTMVHC